MLTRNCDFDKIPSSVLSLSLEKIPKGHKSSLAIFDLILMRISTNCHSDLIRKIVDEINQVIIADGKENLIDLDYKNPEAAKMHTRGKYMFDTNKIVDCLIQKTNKLPINLKIYEMDKVKQLYRFFQNQLDNQPQ